VRRSLSYALTFIGLIAAALLLTRFWISHHHLFPTIPASFGPWLTDLFGATNAESVADIEFLVGFMVFFVLLLLVLLVGRRMLGRF
jgi:hypothetical protein